MDVNYKPITDDCRVCGRSAPHEWRTTGDNIEVVCLGCSALLEIMVGGAQLLTAEMEAANAA